MSDLSRGRLGGDLRDIQEGVREALRQLQMDAINRIHESRKILTKARDELKDREADNLWTGEVRHLARMINNWKQQLTGIINQCGDRPLFRSIKHEARGYLDS